MINKTELNKLRSHIDKNKSFLDGIATLTDDDDKKYSMALSMAVLVEYYGLNQQSAYEALTDKSGDNKIDAFYYSDDEDELGELVIVNSKYKNEDGANGTFTEDDIKLCIANCEKFLRGEDFQTTNETLLGKMVSYRKLLEDNEYPPITIKLFFATNGIIHEGHKILDEVTNCSRRDINAIFIDATLFSNIPLLDKGEMLINLKNDGDKTDSIFKISDDLYDGRVVSCNLEQLMIFYKDTGEKLLLNSNIRYMLKNSKINKEIEKSFINDPKRFCYLNNGITIICSEFDIKPTGHELNKLELIKPCIVNGGQTVATLYQLYNHKDKIYKGQFETSNILIRVYKAPEIYTLVIAKATNSQNPINVVDLHANDEYQDIAKKYISNFGIGLITKLGEDISYYDDTITNERILQVYASLFSDDPAKAKTSKAAIFKKYYDQVFNSGINESMCKKLFRCYQITKFINEQSSEDKVVLQNAFYSIIYSMKKINANLLNENIPHHDMDEHFASSFATAMIHINGIIEQKQAELRSKFSMNNLFKGNEIKDLLDLRIDGQ